MKCATCGGPLRECSHIHNPSDIRTWPTHREVEAERDAALAVLAKVRELCVHARRISDGAAMTVYVADVEAALGDNVPRPHKTGIAAAPLEKETT